MSATMQTRVARNTILVFTTRILSVVLTFGLAILVAKRLGAFGLGGYSLVLAYCFALQQSAALGLHALLPREIARAPERARTLLWAALALSMGTAALFCAGLWAATAWLPYDHDLELALWIGALSLVPGAVTQVAEGFFVAREQGRAVVVIAGLESVLRSLLGLAVVALGGGLVPLTVSFLIGRTLGALVTADQLRRHVPRKAEAGAGSVGGAIRDLARGMPIFAALYVLVSVIFRTDVVVLSLVAGRAEVGVYNAAYRLFDVLVLAPTTAAMVVYPVLARIRHERAGQEAELTGSALTAMLTAVWPFTICVALAAPGIVGFLYDDAEFAGAVPVLALLALDLIPRSVDVLLGHAMLAADRQGADLWILGAMMIVNLVANLVLVPTFGVLGAAAATLFTGTVLAAVHLGYVRRHLYPVPIGPGLLKPLPAVLVTGCFMALVRHAHPLWTLPAGMALYGATAWLTGAVDRRFVSVLVARPAPDGSA